VRIFFFIKFYQRFDYSQVTGIKIGPQGSNPTGPPTRQNPNASDRGGCC
jgi:hypothetical protein